MYEYKFHTTNSTTTTFFQFPRSKLHHTMDYSKPHDHQLHIYFIPTMAPGHMIPMIDIARQFSRLGAKSTIITTPLNASDFSKSIERDQNNGFDINISLFKFPCEEANLPEGCENLSFTTTFEMSLNFFKAFDLLQDPVEKVLQQGNPDGIIAGGLFWWANDIARNLNIPWLKFYGTGYFPLCIYRSLKENKTHEQIQSDTEEFLVPGLPDVVKLTRKQIPDQMKDGGNGPMADLERKILESESGCYGMVVNSFLEMESAYAKCYEEMVGHRAWHIGPVSLFSQSSEDKAHRGRESDSEFSGDRGNCLSWLSSKKPNSVLYVCFGSMAIFSTDQMIEIAKGLENSGQDFIWAFRKNGEEEKFDLFFQEFESRMQGRGLVIRGWAPQVQILDHEAVGGFITHCGWNSVMEGLAAGVPMITWPLSAEQFSNEKLVVEILRIGIPVGAEAWGKRTDERESLKSEKIEKAVGVLVAGEETEGMRNRARELGDLAKRAVEEGGSSDTDLRSLMQELRIYRR